MKKFRYTILIIHLFIFELLLAQNDMSKIVEAQTALQQNKCKYAEQALNECSSDAKETQVWIYYTAKTQDCLENYESAIFWYNKYLKFVPNNAEIIKRVAELSIRKREKDEQNQRAQMQMDKINKDNNLISQLEGLDGKWCWTGLSGKTYDVQIDFFAKEPRNEPNKFPGIYINPNNWGEYGYLEKANAQDPTFMWGRVAFYKSAHYGESFLHKTGDIYFINFSEIYQQFRACHCKTYYSESSSSNPRKGIDLGIEVSVVVSSDYQHIYLQFPNIDFVDSKSNPKSMQGCTYRIIDKNGPLLTLTRKK